LDGFRDGVYESTVEIPEYLLILQYPSHERDHPNFEHGPRSTKAIPILPPSAQLTLY